MKWFVNINRNTKKEFMCTLRDEWELLTSTPKDWHPATFKEYCEDFEYDPFEDLEISLNYVNSVDDILGSYGWGGVNKIILFDCENKPASINVGKAIAQICCKALNDAKAIPDIVQMKLTH